MTEKEQTCLSVAMEAKGRIFRAQDAAEEIEDDERRRKARKLLATARVTLERVDDLLRWGESR